MGDGSRLYVCGTNAHNPKDLVINVSVLTFQTEIISKHVPAYHFANELNKCIPIIPNLQWNLTPLPRQTHVPGIGEGVARCPYDPNDNSTAIWVEHGNPDNLPGLYRYFYSQTYGETKFR